MNKILLSFIFSFYLILSYANNYTERIQFTTTLSGNQMNPTVTTEASGLASFIYNMANDSFYINMGFVELNSVATGIKLYTGSIGSNGTLVKDLTAFLRGNRLSLTIRNTDMKTNIKDWFNGNVYLVIENAKYPNGEIRGQLNLETDYNFIADLKGANTVPSTSTNAFGLGSFTLSHDQHKLGYKIICSKLSGPIKTVELWVGDAGTNGKMEMDISSSVTGNVIEGSINASHSMSSDLFNRKVYLVVGTAANPKGEIRAQLINYKGLVFESWASGDQMYNPVNSGGRAISVMRLSPGLDTLYYDSVSDGLAAVDYAHLHVGRVGEPYGALQVDFTSTIAGARIQGFKRNIGAASINRLLNSSLAFLYHTPKYQEGEIRGTVLRYARNGFAINMDVHQVTPAPGSQAYGSAIISTSRNDENVFYKWIAGNLTSQAKSSHFKNTLSGVSGPVVYDLTPDMIAANNTARGSGYWTDIDNPPFSIGSSNQFASQSIYLEVSTVNNPNGEIRGQVTTTSMVLLPTRVEDRSYDREIIISPNPVMNELLIELNENFEIEDLLIFNEIGVMIKKVPLEKSTKVDMSNLPKGIYSIRIDHDHRFARRIIKL
jgi:hypothetical protein